MDITEFESRKKDHLNLALRPENEALGQSGLDSIHLHHCALPEMDFGDVEIQTQFWKYPANSPCFVSSMTAGHQAGEALNLRIATVAQKMRWPMGIGSQRRELHDGTAAQEAKRLRAAVPNACLFSNIGLTQIIRSPVDDIKSLVDSLEAQALFVHCNALQEALQPEGTPQFAGGLQAIKTLCAQLELPVIVKETGCGFSASDISRLAECGVAAIDISGYGGTHWGRIEAARAQDASLQRQSAVDFAHWGEPTVDSLLTAVAVRSESSADFPIWASGGIRNGLDVAKCLALGAEKVGFAKPVLEQVLIGEENLASWMELIEFELKVAMFCTGTLRTVEAGNIKWRRI